jgi:gamma-butyrobetaine dioxygenase
MKIQSVAFTPDTLTVFWEDGKQAAFDSLFLYDNQLGHRDPFSGQRLIDVADLPETVSLTQVCWDGECLQITFSVSDTPVSYPIRFFVPSQNPLPERHLWYASSTANLPRIAWEAYYTSPNSRRDWLHGFIRYGLAFLHDVPPMPGTLETVAETLGTVRETNYGRIFDVCYTPQPENLASSDLGLPLHTDNPYREPVPGVQLLHILQQSSQGGDSLFADGFAVAEHLRSTVPTAFQVLTMTPVPFRYCSKQCDLYAERSLIQLDRNGIVEAIHYNNRSIQPVFLPLSETRAFYDAYRSLAHALSSPEFVYSVKLQAGDLVAFDNRRVLHGRAGFAGATDPRHLQGCYLEWDGIYSAYRRTLPSLLREEVKK